MFKKIYLKTFPNIILLTKSLKNRNLKNNSEYAYYKSANTDVVGLIVEKVSGKTLRDWILSAVEAAGFEDGLYIAYDRLR